MVGVDERQLRILDAVDQFHRRHAGPTEPVRQTFARGPIARNLPVLVRMSTSRSVAGWP